MPDNRSYWTRTLISRRTALRGAAAAGGGLAALSLAGCGGGSTKKEPAKAPSAAVVSTQGTPGGSFSYSPPAAPTNLDVFSSTNQGMVRTSGLAYNGLLAYKFGQAGVDVMDLSLEPDLAQAMPEQPDQTTYVFKLRPGVKFHNGRAMTAEDVKYSFDRYAKDDKSAWKTQWLWYDRVETPDPLTAVVKTKFPFADTPLKLGSRSADAYVHAREHAESPDALSKYVGTGPYIVSDYQTNTSISFRKNPDYHLKPYPYFNEVKAFFVGDVAKRIADFSSKQLNLTFWFDNDGIDQITKARPDAGYDVMQNPSDFIFMRSDKPPFNDRRVRQAMSMSINRKVIREATSKGEGEDDHPFMVCQSYWGARKVKDLGANAKLWDYNPAEAKKLLQAAGPNLPLDISWLRTDAAPYGPSYVDRAVLTTANWKELGLFKVTDDVRLSTAFNQARLEGKQESMGHGPSNPSPDIGSYLSDFHYTSAAGVRSTSNDSYINDSKLNTVIDKQRGELNLEERKKLFRQFEDIVAEEQYRPAFGTYPLAYFWDGRVKNARVPLPQTNFRWIQRWWFGA